jgi:ABC-2 type transport system ATP-binding protein
VGRLLVRDVIRELRAAGTAVFLNSHLLGEIEVTCDRVAFIRHGEVVRMDTLTELLRAPRRVEVRGGGLSEDLVRKLAARGFVARIEGRTASIEVSGEERIPELARFLVEEGVALESLTPARATLEQLFLDILGAEGGL